MQYNPAHYKSLIRKTELRVSNEDRSQQEVNKLYTTQKYLKSYDLTNRTITTTTTVKKT